VVVVVDKMVAVVQQAAQVILFLLLYLAPAGVPAEFVAVAVAVALVVLQDL
jgi:hypothetical protein